MTKPREMIAGLILSSFADLIGESPYQFRIFLKSYASGLGTYFFAAS